MDGCIPLLLIDDDENYVDLMKMILEGEGYSVDRAYNGQDGVVKYVPGKYATVLTDYIMPVLKGDEVAERIRQLDANVHIILLTGYKLAISPSTLKRFNSVLEKPINPVHILTALCMIVRGQPIRVEAR
jgi:two-component system, OmpR family, response regulator VicR